MKKIIFILILIYAKINAQTKLNITISDAQNQLKIISFTIYNSSSKNCVIPIDKSDFQPFGEQKPKSFRPFIELFTSKKNIKYSTKIAEFDEAEIDLIAKGETIPEYKKKVEYIEIKPKDSVNFSMVFNPFEFDVRDKVFSSYEITSKKDYFLKLKIRSGKNEKADNKCFKNVIESNIVKTHWSF